MDDDVLQVQRLYPRIYVACHVKHNQGAEPPDGLTWREASLLAHIAEGKDGSRSSPSELASHLNVTRATLSEALTRLVELGHAISEVDPDDERRRRLRLTRRGVSALSRSSVLEYSKLKRGLDRLDAGERRKVIEGLELLARAVGP